MIAYPEIPVRSSVSSGRSSEIRHSTSVFALGEKIYFHFCMAEVETNRMIGAMTEMEYKNALEAQKREMQIMLIREKHPVYKDFNFTRYSDQKVAEMYKVLVENFHNG